MRKTISKILTFSLLTSVFFTGLPVYASDFNIISSNEKSTSLVKADMESNFSIRIPKSIILIDDGSKYTADYNITVTGDIAGNEILSVKPDTNVTLGSKNKANITAPVIQDKIYWTFNEFSIIGNGNISSTEVTAGDWAGYLNFNINLETNANITVEATDSNGNDLNASASNIIGEEKEKLLNSLKESGLVNDTDEVKALIDVQSDNFEGLANTKFNVDSIANPGDTIVILHFNENKGEWEYISTETVKEDGTVSSNFSSYSPVAFVKVNEDGSFEKIEQPENIEYTSFKLSKNNYTQTGLQSLEGDVVIPETFEYQGVNYKVTSIESSVFERKTGLKSVVIPDSVTSIGASAFYNCTNLSSVVFEEGSQLTSIGRNAFYNCSALTSIEIPTGVITIDSNAFKNCKNLSNMTIPNTVINVSKNSFDGTSWLTNQKELSENNLVIVGNNVLIDGTSATGDVVIPNEVTSISEGAFLSNKNITSVVIPANVKEIPRTAFSSCASLNSVIFEENSQLEKIGESAFTYCNNLKNISIPEGVVTIEGEAFSSTGLVSINIPSTVQLFGNMTNQYIKSFNVAEGNTVYSSENGVLFNKNKDTLIKYPLANDNISYTIPNSVKTIKNNAFGGCEKLVSIEIPESVTTIESSAFYGCSGLTNIEIPSSIDAILDYTFSDCSKLTTVTIPSNIISIGEGAFYSNISLENIVFEEGHKLESIGSRAFYNCYNLKSIEIPNTVISIGNSPFGTSGIEEITFEENSQLMTLNGVFSDCYNLRKAQIPESITSIEYYVFNNCTNLETVIVHNNLTSIEDYAFSYCTKGLTLDLSNTSIYSIGYNAFQYCDNLTIYLPNSLDIIKGYAFDSTNINSINIPSSVTIIEDYAFSNCSIQSITNEINYEQCTIGEGNDILKSY